MPREILLVCLAGGVLALDTTAAWQLMLSQPLVSGTVAGLLLGAPHVGVFIGLVLQLLWSGAIPLGALPMPDAPVGTVSGVWFAVTLLEAHGSASFSACCLLGLMAAFCVALLGRRTIMLERSISAGLFRNLVRRVSEGKEVSPETAISFALMTSFARGFVLCLLATSVLALASTLLAKHPALLERDYSHTLFVLEALGVGVLFSVFVGRSKGRLLALVGGMAWAFLIINLVNR